MMIKKDSLQTPAPHGRTGNLTEMTMQTVQHQLSDIFVRLFEDMAPEDVRHASITTIPDWDAMTTLSLIVEAEDTFGIDLGFDVADEIMSFSDLYAHVVIAMQESGRFRFTATGLALGLEHRKPSGNA